jgi:hypothetical protein
MKDSPEWAGLTKPTKPEHSIEAACKEPFEARGVFMNYPGE